jgi:hypothetical protein
MLTITLKPDIAEEVERLTQDTHTTPDAVVDSALRAYLLDFEREKIKVETARFNEQKQALLSQYENQYIAMHNGQVIDHDVELWVLHERVIEKLGNTPVLLKKVTSRSDADIVLHSPKLEKPDK